MLLQVPRPRIEKGDDRDPSGAFSLASFLPPSRLVSIATGEKSGPSFAEEVGDDDDKGSLDGDISWFELDGRSAYVDVEVGTGHVDHLKPTHVNALTYRVDLAHDGLESGEYSG